MSSTAHWLVLGAAASRAKGFIYMGNWAFNTHTHFIFMLFEHKLLHGQKKKRGRTRVPAYSVRHVHSGVLSPSPPHNSQKKLELCYCPSNWALTPCLLCLVLPLRLPMSSFSCGRRCSSHFGFPQDREKRKKTHFSFSSLLQYLSHCVASQIIFTSSAEFVKCSTSQGLERRRQSMRIFCDVNGGKQARPRCGQSRATIRYCVCESLTLKMYNVVYLN